MSKILCCLSNAIVFDNKFRMACFYEQIVTELARCGNEVLVYIPNLFQTVCFDSENPLKDEIDEEKLREDISTFNPDLVITFNNAIYNKILEVVNCDVAVWDADLLFCWNQREYIKQNLDRYLFFCFSEDNMKYPKAAFGCSDDRVFNIKPATSFVPSNIEKRTNISFIGTNYGIFGKIVELIKQYSGTDDIKNFLKAIRENPMISSAELIEKINPTVEFVKSMNEIPSKEYVIPFSRENRLLALSSVADLGLDVYGDSSWGELTYVLPSLAACKKQRIVFSAKDNEDIYNGSKICLSTNHAQAVSGIPCRIPDILGTSGCLVSIYTPYIEQAFKGANIPFFEHPVDARAICKKLLNDESRRSDIVASCNEVVNKNWRWENRFKEIEQITGISLFGASEGSYTILQPCFKQAALKNPIEIKPVEKKKRMKFKYKILYKVWKHIGKKLKKKGIV